jgi:tripartite-type tricarboxylate transporter receptor subunit TctC
MAPAKTPQPVITAVHKAIATVLEAPEVRKRLTGMGYIVVGSGPDQLTAHIRTESERYARLIRQIGLPPQ